MNDFYTVHELQSGNEAVSCIIVFDEAHEIFKGHFPQQPVVPGVCMIHIIKELFQRQLGKKLLLRHAAQVKFLCLVTPEISPEINMSWKKSDEGYAVNAVFKKEADFFKFSGVFETA